MTDGRLPPNRGSYVTDERRRQPGWIGVQDALFISARRFFHGRERLWWSRDHALVWLQATVPRPRATQASPRPRAGLAAGNVAKAESNSCIAETTRWSGCRQRCQGREQLLHRRDHAMVWVRATWVSSRPRDGLGASSVGLTESSVGLIETTRWSGCEQRRSHREQRWPHRHHALVWVRAMWVSPRAALAASRPRVGLGVSNMGVGEADPALAPVGEDATRCSRQVTGCPPEADTGLGSVEAPRAASLHAHKCLSPFTPGLRRTTFALGRFVVHFEAASGQGIQRMAGEGRYSDGTLWS
jgi:hypothetical protein